MKRCAEFRSPGFAVYVLLNEQIVGLLFVCLTVGLPKSLPRSSVHEELHVNEYFLNVSVPRDSPGYISWQFDASDVRASVLDLPSGHVAVIAPSSGHVAARAVFWPRGGHSPVF